MKIDVWLKKTLAEMLEYKKSHTEKDTIEEFAIVLETGIQEEIDAIEYECENKIGNLRDEVDNLRYSRTYNTMGRL